MKISEIIEELEALKKQHGDTDVAIQIYDDKGVKNYAANSIGWTKSKIYNDDEYANLSLKFAGHFAYFGVVLK